MLKGQRWKIYLGRRIVRNFDDLDGSMFLEELLDEITHSLRSNRWETIQAGGIWITRPRAFLRNEDDDDNEYNYGPDGDIVFSDDDIGNEVYREDAEFLAAQKMLPNPLRQQDDDYENDAESSEPETPDLDNDGDAKMEEPDEEELDELESDSDWSAYDPTEQERKRNPGFFKNKDGKKKEIVEKSTASDTETSYSDWNSDAEL